MRGGGGASPFPHAQNFRVNIITFHNDRASKHLDLLLSSVLFVFCKTFVGVAKSFSYDAVTGNNIDLQLGHPATHH